MMEAKEIRKRRVSENCQRTLRAAGCGLRAAGCVLRAACRIRSATFYQGGDSAMPPPDVLYVRAVDPTGNVSGPVRITIPPGP